MKKIIAIMSILAVFGIANAQFKDPLTDEVPNLRVNAMGGVYSLIETSNYTDFPQRLITGQEGAWIGSNESNSWGLVRFNLNNFLSLPKSLSWQISAEQGDLVSIEEIFNQVGYFSAHHIDAMSTNTEVNDHASNRINSIFAVKLDENMSAGLGLKLYSNSSEGSEGNFSWENSLWGLETTWGITRMFNEEDFLDASLDLDFWGWDGTETRDSVKVTSSSKGVWNIGFNARYYNTGTKVDYSPYLKLNYFFFGQENSSHPDRIYYGLLYNYTLGSGIHYKPADGVKVYNDVEFKYQNVYQLQDPKASDYSESVMTILPIYRMGVELTKELNSEKWWFNTVQIWGGFNKTFYNEWSDDSTDKVTELTPEDVKITTGFALQNGNFKLELQTEDAVDADYVSMGLVYMFEK